MGHLRRAGDPRELRYEPETFSLEIRKGEVSIGYVNLANLYREFLGRSRASRKEFFAHATRSLLASFKAMPSELPDAQFDLMPVVRGRSYFTLTELENWTAGRHDFAWPHQPLGTYFAVGLAYDLPEAMIMMQQTQLDRWSTTYYEALELARGNLAEREMAVAKVDDHLYVSATGDSYDASRLLLLPEISDRLELQGHPIVMAPNRDRLLIVGSDDPVGLRLMAHMAQESLQNPRPLGGYALQLRDDRWSPWLPETDQSYYRDFFEMYVGSLANDYQRQCERLVNWFSRQGRTVDVPKYQVEDQLPNGRIETFCVWAGQNEVLLPRTQRVFLFPESADSDEPPAGSIRAEWSWLQEVLGDQLEPQDMYPIRYRVRRFPSPDQLRRLARASRRG